MNKRIAAMMLTAIMLMTSCSQTTPTTGTGSSGEQTGVLVNHMTQTELQRSSQTDFRLLDHPWESRMNTGDKTDFTVFKDKVCFVPNIGAVVYGEPVFNAFPPEGYDGGSGTVVFLHVDQKTGETSPEELSFDNYDDLKLKLRAEYDGCIASGYPKVPADEEYDCLIKLYDAVIEGSAEQIDGSLLDEYLDFYYSGGAQNKDSYYWEMDDKAVEAIKDSISEYHIYDGELDMSFVVHVTTPPSYDKQKMYPALVMTDAVWRFDDVTSLYDLMSKGSADPQYLITIGFEYDVDGWDNEVRGNILCNRKKEFLDFITDNMMPYLGGQYRIDYGASTLFGHSQGGVFAHYAAFNYDRYENRPFSNYIIASPVFWTPYFTGVSDYPQYRNEYGFFDRNDTYGNNIFIAFGDAEDADYEDSFGGNDSTTEGVAHLAERLDSHGVTTYKVKSYSSNHYRYVPAMLMEYVQNKV